jgi:hypothetical protein
MTIFIEIEGSNDLKELANSVNEEQELDVKISHIREYLRYYWDDEIVRVNITIGSRR